MKEDVVKLVVRLPHDIKSFVAQQSSLNGCSQNSEIIRAVRERMDRVQREEMPAPAGE